MSKILTRVTLRIQIIVGAVVAVASAASAAVVIWSGNGADPQWTTPTNWAGTAPVANDSLQFAGSNQLTNNNDIAANTAFTGITFNSGAGPFVLNGNAINLAGNVTNNSTSLQTINLPLALTATRTFTMTAGGGDLTLGNIVSGAFGVTSAGTGTLSLNGPNTYTGTTTVGATTTVKLGSATALGTTAGGTTVNGVLDLNGQTIVGENLTLGPNSSVINSNTTTAASSSGTVGAGANSVTLGGPGNLAISGAITSTTAGTVIKGGAGNLTLSASNTALDGIVRIDAGTLIVSTSSNALGDTTNRANVQLNGGSLAIRNDTALALNNNLSLLASAGTITLDRATAGAGVTHTMSGGTFTMASGATLDVIAGGNITSGTAGLTLGNSTLNGPVTFNIVSPPIGLTTLTLGTVTNSTSASITKQGTGDLITNGTNAFGGAAGGALDVQAGRIGWSNNTAATIINEAGAISGAGGVIKTGASTVNLTNTANTFTGPVTLGGGVLGFASLADGADITFTASATLSYIGATNLTVNRNLIETAATGVNPTLAANGTGGAVITYSAPIALQGNSLTLTGSGDGVLSSTVTNTGGGITADVTKTGTGMWTLNGVAAIDDDLIVNQGTLALNAVNAHRGDDLFVRGTGTVVRLGVNGALVRESVAGATDGMDSLFINDANGTVAGGTATLDINGTTGSIVNVIQLGSSQYTTPGQPATTTLSGALIDTLGVGSITVGSLDLRSGIVSADVTIAAAGTMTKQTQGTVTISSTIAPSTGTTVITGGNLILDYTTENTNKLNSAGQLQVSGGTLTLNGNATAPTTQTVTGLNLNTLGNTDIVINPGAGGATTLDVGAITRSAGSTVNFVLPSTDAVVSTTATNTNGILGGYAITTTPAGNYFAAVSGGRIVATTSFVADVLSRQWASTLTNPNVTDGTSFTGTTDYMNVNSLRVSAANPLNVLENLNLASGGLLVASSSTSPGVLGGTISTGTTNELIVTQESATDFTISSAIRRLNNSAGATDVTKSGPGTLILSGNNFTGDRSVANTASGTVRLALGTLVLSGGRAVSDNTSVTLESLPGVTLRLASSETIGALSGGSIEGGTIDLGANTLIINQSSSQTFGGTLTGTGKIVKNNLGPAGAATNLNFTNNNSATAFTGTVEVNGGLFQLSGNGISNLTGATAFTVNKGGALLVDNDGASTAPPGAERIGDTAAITLNGANGTFGAQTSFRGLATRNDQNSTRTENVGALTLGASANYAALESSTTATNTASVAIINAASLTRANNATLSVRGTNLGTSTTASRTRLTVTATGNADEAFGNQFRIGGTSANGGTAAGTNAAAGTKNISIVPWAIGESLGTTAAPARLATTNIQTGNSLVTYEASYGSATNGGFRPLDLTTEYNTYTASSGIGNGDNVRESLNGVDVTGLTSKTINALVVNNQSLTTANSMLGTGTGGQTMTVTTGTFLFTAVDATGAQVATPQGVTIDGFDGGIAATSGEYIVFVPNTALVGVTIASSLNTGGSKLTKSGLGLLNLTGANAAGAGGVTLNEGTLQIADLDNVGGNTGAFTFAGGTLKLGAAWTDDLSTRTLTVLGSSDGAGANNGAWGRLDTNGVNTTFSAGNLTGAGEFVKAGAGTLTLAATTATTHTGTFVVEQTGSGTTTPLVAQLVLNNTGGNAIGGNLQIGAYTVPAANGTAVVQLGRAEQVADTAVISFTGAASKNAYFKMAGFNEAVAGIQDISSNGVIENVESETTATLPGANTNAVLTLTGSGDYYYNGFIRNRASGTATGTVGLVMQGAGSQTLAGANIIYTGATTVTSGLLRLRDTTAFNSDVANSTKLEMERTNTTAWTYSKVISGSGDVIKTGAGTGQTNLSGVNTYTGLTEIQAGNLRLTTAGSINDSRAVLVKPGATFDVSGRTGGTYTYDGQLSGEGTVTGSLVLSNNVGAVNTSGMLKPGGSTDPSALATTGDELGTLTFSSGSLTLNGGAGGAEAVLQVLRATLNDAATVSSSTSGGTITLAAGASPGTIAAWNGASLLDAAGLPAHDSVNFLTGGLVWNTGSIIHVDPTLGYTATYGDIIDLFDWVTAVSGTGNLGDGGTGTRGGGVIGDLDLPALSGDLMWDVSLFKSDGIIAVAGIVPEPGRAMLLLVGALSVLARRRRLPAGSSLPRPQRL